MANSADDKLVIFFLFVRGNRIWHFWQIFSVGDNFIEMSNPSLWEKYFKMSSENFTQSTRPKIKTVHCVDKLLWQYWKNVMLSAMAVSLRWANCGPWASCCNFHVVRKYEVIIILQNIIGAHIYISCNTGKSTFLHVYIMKLKSASTSAQSDQSLLYTWRNFVSLAIDQMCPVKILIRLSEWAGWSESLLGVHAWRYVFSDVNAHIICIFQK